MTELESAIETIKAGRAFGQVCYIPGERFEIDEAKRVIDELPSVQQPEYDIRHAMDGRLFLHITCDSPVNMCAAHGHWFGNFYLTDDDVIHGTCERCQIEQEFDEATYREISNFRRPPQPVKESHP